MRIEYRRVPLFFGPCGYGIVFRRCRAALAWAGDFYDGMGPGVKEALREWKQGTGGSRTILCAMSSLCKLARGD